MSTSTTSINVLPREFLAKIFTFLPPDDRVRLERVCKKWQNIAKKDGWTEFKTLMMAWKELEKRGDLAVAKNLALMDRCRSHLRKLSITAPGEFKEEMRRNYRTGNFEVIENLHYLERKWNIRELVKNNAEQCTWTGMHNLRHLRIDVCMRSDTLRAIADNLKHLQSIHFCDIV